MIWKCSQYAFDTRMPIIMGILNMTPDSFSDGGTFNSFQKAMDHAHEMIEDGALIIDVGGESTRPGSAPVSCEEEISRVIDVVRALAEEGVCVSIDTRHAPVAQAAVEAGATIINDVSGFRDPAMVEVAKNCDAGLVVMHMQGEPATMQDDPQYNDVVNDVYDALKARCAELEEAGIAHNRICIDPGPGFGKTFEHNQRLISHTGQLAQLGYPLMVAVSRKSYIGAATGIERPADRDEASALCAAAACREGALVARVHNVAATAHAFAGSKRAVVALGSNIGDRCAQLDAAVRALRRVPGIWVYSVSSYYESEPAYREDQAAFANAAAVIETLLSPAELLDALHGIEDAQGRVRLQENGPRTLDLDILDYEGCCCDTAQLSLPHPRLLERDFTVTPLLELFDSYTLADGRPVDRSQIAYGKIAGVLRRS